MVELMTVRLAELVNAMTLLERRRPPNYLGDRAKPKCRSHSYDSTTTLTERSPNGKTMPVFGNVLPTANGSATQGEQVAMLILGHVGEGGGFPGPLLAATR